MIDYITIATLGDAIDFGKLFNRMSLLMVLYIRWNKRIYLQVVHCCNQSYKMYRIYYDCNTGNAKILVIITFNAGNLSIVVNTVQRY